VKSLRHGLLLALASIAGAQSQPAQNPVKFADLYDLLFSYPGTNWANQTKKVTGATLTNAGR
jgi:hypothetical protein